MQPRVSTSAAENKGGDTQISDLVSQLEASIPPILDKEEHAKDIFKLNNKGLMHCLATVLL